MCRVGHFVLRGLYYVRPSPIEKKGDTMKQKRRLKGLVFVLAVLGFISMASIISIGCSGSDSSFYVSGNEQVGAGTADDTTTDDTTTDDATTGDAATGDGAGQDIIGSAGTAAGTTGFVKKTVLASGQPRSVNFFAPPNRGGSPALLIAFHGTSSYADGLINQEEGDPSGLEDLASEKGFVVAAPQSRSWETGDTDWDNHDGDIYWETRSDSNPTRGSDPELNHDLKLVQQIITDAQNTYHINPKRIYTLGMSNGAFFSELVAMTLPDKIAAFAEISGGLVKCDKTGGVDHHGTCNYRATAGTTDCGAILTAASSSFCASCVGDPKPIAVQSTRRKVPGFLAHNNRDPTVSVYYTCTLAKQMNDLGYTTAVMIGDAAGHEAPEGALLHIWSFLTTKSLP